MTLLPLILIAPLLILCAWSDLRRMRIPDWLSLLAVAIFALSLLVAIPPDIRSRLIVAGVVFAAGFLAFVFRLFGGGDVKILSALMLFIPAPLLPLYGVLFAASIAAGILLILGLRALPAGWAPGWQSVARKGTLPLGVPIALSGLSLPLVVALSGQPIF